MDPYERRMYIRKALSQFKSLNDVSFLVKQLFQNDLKVLKRMKMSLNERVGRRGIKDFLQHLEDKILLMTEKTSDKWLHYCSFIDLIAFHCFKSNCTWNTFELTDSKIGNINMEDFIKIRSNIKAHLPQNNANSVQQLVSYVKDEKKVISYATFRIISLNVSKAMLKDPIKIQEQKVKAKPLYLVYFNGSPYAYSPSKTIKNIIQEGILGGFQCTQVIDTELRSKDLYSLYIIEKDKNSEKRNYKIAQLENIDTNVDIDTQSPVKKIILNDLTIQYNPTLKKSKVNDRSVKAVLRVHGEDIDKGLKELKNLGLIKDTSSKWINQVSQIKKNDLVISQGTLRPNKNPMCTGPEWHQRLKSVYWKGI
uniref:Uncharacterized protein n=1 Tax=Lepeophtheirus salmonis TaxID=72036 RepID=A0A0K2U025_LEPSM